MEVEYERKGLTKGRPCKNQNTFTIRKGLFEQE